MDMTSSPNLPRRWDECKWASIKGLWLIDLRGHCAQFTDALARAQESNVSPRRPQVKPRGLKIKLNKRGRFAQVTP